MSTTIVIADDHALFRQGLASLVREHSKWEIVGEASDGEEVLRLVEAIRPRVVVLDVEMPGINGIEAARRISQGFPETAIVALSMYSDAQHLESMLGAGAAAYVLKNEAIDDLIRAITTVLDGGRFVSAAAAQHAFEQPRPAAVPDVTQLSRRELEVLRLLAKGRRTKEIAADLQISAKTVETYRSRVMLKLGIDNLPGLVRFAIQAGVISAEI